MKTAIVLVNRSVVEFKTYSKEAWLIKYAQKMFDKYENPTVEIWENGKCVKAYG